MNNFKKQFKALYKKYNKQLKLQHKNNFEQKLSNNIDYFITYLKFMRDYYILTEPLVLESGEENLKIASLATAISEYEKAETCIYNYYIINEKGTPLTRKIAGTEEEVLQKYNLEKAFHRNTFWQIISTNMEGWLNND